MIISLIDNIKGKTLMTGDIEHIILNFLGIEKAKKLPPGKYMLSAENKHGVSIQEEIIR